MPARPNHTRHKKVKVNTIAVMDYNASHLEEKKTTKIEDCVSYKDTPTVTWINIDNVPPADFLHELSLGFDLHPVILQDILTPDQRPKVEVMEEYIYVVVKMLYVGPDGKRLINEQVSFILAKKFVISTQQGIDGDVFDPVRQAIQNERSTTRHSGTDYLFYKLLDAVVNAYFQVLEIHGDKMEQLEEDMLYNPTTKTLHTLYGLKRSILDMRKAVWPLRELIATLERGDSVLIKKNTEIYLRDLYERVVELIDTIEVQRETLTGLLDVYLSSASNKMNSVMKVLTMIATIFMPLSFLAGVYGMNFRYMPGLESRGGFALMLAAMLAVFVAMLMYFMRKKWL